MTSQKIKALKNILNEDQICSDESTLKVYGTDWLNLYPSNPSLVLFPKSHKNTEDIINWALEFNCPLVPSGGRTGLSGGASASHGETVVSFEKMNKILEFNETDQSLTAEPGVITKTIQDYARKKSLFFPISFASEGSSQIGGNTAANAGGMRVIRWGGIRKWILGLKVITGEGRTLHLGKGLIKNTAGFDLMNLFIGSEGALGMFTEITVGLTTPPKPSSVFLFAVPDLQNLISLYILFKKALCLNAFEMFCETSLKYSLETSSSAPFPLKQKSPYYVILECPEQEQEKALTLFEQALEKGFISDGAAGESPAQAEKLWSFRENISEGLSQNHTPYKNDISVKISDLPKFLSSASTLLQKEYPGFTTAWFGHIGDGNLHINILKPDKILQEDFVKKCESVNTLLFSLIKKFNGSISAEHGVGKLKKPYLHYSCSSEDLYYMKALKNTFDPKNILNPGKIL